jgi:beta-fructofuranosidase
VDYDNSTTTYDTSGIFTGSVTVVDGSPVATYPGEPGDHMCEASPVDLTDPLLTQWRKSKANPIKPTGPSVSGPLGCTSAWKEASGNWTTTIQSNDVGNGLKTTFWTSHDYVQWSYVGVLHGCAVCDACVQSCSDFFPAPATGGGIDASKWVFGINTGGCGLASGGLVAGTFDRATLTFTPDHRPWADAATTGDRVAVQHYAYDYTKVLYPKNYESEDGRRIAYGWLDVEPPGYTNWTGVHTLPRVVSPSSEDDITNAMLSSPAREVTALRTRKLASVRGMRFATGRAAETATSMQQPLRQAGGHSAARPLLSTPRADWQPVPGVASVRLDITVTWRGLASLPAGLVGFQPQLMLFAPTNSSDSLAGPQLSWARDTRGGASGSASAPPAGAGIGGGGAGGGWVNGTAGGMGSGPLALRAGQDSLALRVLVDGSVVEAFWDGGRARTTGQFFPADPGATGLRVSAGAGAAAVTADIDVWEMGNMWINKPAGS